MLKKISIGLMLIFSLSLLLPAATAPAPGTEEDTWKQGLLKERADKDAEFKTSPTSPMAGRERLTIAAAKKTFILVRAGGAVAVAPQAAAGAAFSLLCRDGKWYWDDASPGVECRLEGRIVGSGGEELSPGCLFRAGRLTLAAYPGADSMALIVFDPQRSQLLRFSHLLYFPPDPRYAVKARLEKFAEQKPVKITTTRKLEKTFYRYGKVRFRLAGRELELTALKTSLEGPDAQYLFIPFKDATNGRETYEVGRFIDVPDPGQNEFFLDFNRCYNPLCNYSPAYNCPLPPLENILDIAVPAGEKTYPH
jgi:uncharacterized protein (DUF1684 family)